MGKLHIKSKAGGRFLVAHPLIAFFHPDQALLVAGVSVTALVTDGAGVPVKT